MTDIPGDISTTGSITVGGSVTNSLEVTGDHDWFRLELTAGQTVIISLNGSGGSPLGDPYLRFRDAAGALITENDDSGGTFNSRLAYTAPTAGVYYIDVGAYGESYAGTYQLQVQLYTPPPLFTYEEIADQLINGYWESGGGAGARFNVTSGGSITYNVQALTTEGQNLAVEALNLWSDVTGITFTPVDTGGQIVFDDDDDGAFAQWSSSGGFITSAEVNVSTDWLVSNGTGLNSYSFQTYLHEIGHALGLGHGGNYNGAADYLTDAHYGNDSWATTIMSYFDQTDNLYFGSLGFTEMLVVTPMIADIVAMSLMYGLSTTTRTDDTTYGFNSNAGRAVFNAALHPNVAYTIFDSGGTDTLDYSGFANSQVIDLRPERFSNIGGSVGNVSIGRGVVIENAIGGSGNDLLIGNAANNLLNGGAGSDTASFAGATAGVTINLGLTTPQSTGGAGTDRLLGMENLVGSNFADTLTGNGGGNILEGGGGNDLLNGGAGTDSASYASATSYVTVNLGVTGAQNTRGAGTDTLSGFERLIGSAHNDQLTGDSADNRLEGAAGNDVLRGASGNDTLFGGDGEDRLEGGAGNDTLNGNTGRDTAVYSSASSGVTVNLALSGAQNTVGAGNDTLSSIERLIGSNFGDTLTGNTSNNVLYGENGNDTLIASGGSDVLFGGTGNDTLTGDGGRDTFVFNTALNGTTNVDTLSDYAVAYDKIQLDDDIFTAIGAIGTLSVGAFRAGTAAADTDDRIIYDGATGRIYYDADGSNPGAQVLFAQVGAGLILANTDFQIIG